MSDEPEVSEAGNPIHRYSDMRPDDGPVVGEPETVAAVTAHIEQHIGPVTVVFHELVSAYVHVDVYHVAPSAERPFHTLVTSGMSDRPMTTPSDCAELAWAEVLICLDPSWPISEAAFNDERHYWPVRWLKQLARFPHQYETWLSWGHSMPNGDPAEPFAADTGLAGVMLLPPLSLPEAVHELALPDGRTVHFWGVVPLYPEEMEFKLRKGTDALLRRFSRNGVGDLVVRQRVNTAQRRGWWPF